MILLVVASAAALCAALLTRGGLSRRLPAAAIPLTLWLLAERPQVPWPGATGVVLPRNATIADIEAMLAITKSGAEVELPADGIHPELLPLLADRTVRWDPPRAPVGLAELAWPRRVVVGEPVRVHGRLDVADSVMIRLTAPDGSVDSLRTDSLFRFTMVPRAPGRWTMHLQVSGAAITLGVQVVPAPRVRVMIVAGRPDFEVPALVRRLTAQDADVTVRTRLTRDRERVEQWGRTPVASRLSKAVLDSLDLMVLASGALPSLSSNERALLVSAVDSGLGLLHLDHAPFAAGPLTPFALQRVGSERSTPLRLDSTLTVGAVRIDAIAAPDSLAYLRDSAGRGVAWRASQGLGTIAATAISTAHRLSLAGHPDTEAAWWASLLGPLLRAPSGRWLVSDSAMVQRDEPLTLRWIGDSLPTAVVREPTATSSARLIHGTGEETSSLRLWPGDTGWVSVAGGGDTLDLLVAPQGTYAGLAATARRRALAGRSDAQPGPAQTGRRPLPPLVSLVLLLGSVALAWRPR